MLPNNSKTMTSKSTFLIVLLGVSSIAVSASEDAGTDFCSPFSFKNCSCFKIKEYEMQCPATKLNVVVHLIPQEYINIDCYNQTEYQLNVLPDVNIDIQTFKVRFCNLEVLRFKDILQKFNITNLKRLYIEECILGSKSLSQINATFFEGINSLESLSISTISKTFAENLFEDFPNLNQLYLEQNKLTDIGYFFENNPKLKVLHLSRNSLKSLPDGVFKKLSNLQELHLWKNELTEITENHFKGLKSLKSLELSINFISRIEKNAFSDLNDLVNISLRSNQLRNISSNIFKHNTKLENIRIGRNPHLIISDYIFANLTNLKTISIDNSHLENIFEHTFENCTSLISLEMQNNKLKQLGRNLFKTLKKLTNLNLSYNKLKSLPNTTFLSLGNLEELNLEHNQLSVINRSTFHGLSKLKILNLKMNRISYIDPVAFSYLSNLITLDLSFNQWNEESINVFSYLEKIEQLNLSNNNISFFLENVLQSSVNLKKLDLSYNNLSYLEVVSLVKVSRYNVIINIDHNNISEINFSGAVLIAQQNKENIIKADAYHNSNFTNTQVDISNNPLICDCRNYELIKYLRGEIDPYLRTLIDITMQDMKCSGPKDFEHILIKDLSPEQITCEDKQDCPPQCACFQRPYDNAFVVDCSHRNLTYLPTLSIKHHRLEFNGVGNSLKSGPKEDEGYENVVNLYLSNNELTSFEWCPPFIEAINLSHNNLKMLNPDVLNIFNTSSKFSKLILGQNPWTCGCSALELQNFIKTHYMKIDINNVLCEDDNNPLIEKKELCKSKFTIVIQIIIPILTFFLLAAIAIAFYFRYKREIKIWLYSKGWCLWWVTEEEIDKDKKYDIFLSFSHKDEDFVLENLMPSLEKSFKLCIHSRDWIPGELINDQIVDSVYNSRRTLVLLSNNFLESAWGKLEFLMAHKQSLEEGRPRVIVIKLGNLDMKKMDNDFKAYIKTNTYVEWGEDGFWKKLMYALPHSTKNIAKTNQKHANMMLKIDDKFELAAHPMSHPDSTPPVVSVDTTLLKKHPLNFSVSSSINNFQSEVPLIK